MMERIEEEVKKDWRQERLEVTTPQLTSVVHLNESTVAYADSTELLGRSLHAAEWSLGPSHDMTILAASDLASVLMQTDSVEAHDQAEHLLRRCVRHWRQKDSEEGSLPSLRTVAAVRALATMTTTLKRPGMLDCAREALGVVQQYGERGFYHPEHVQALKGLARALLANDPADDAMEAEALLRTASSMEAVMATMEEEFVNVMNAASLSSSAAREEMLANWRVTTLPVQVKAWFDLVGENKESSDLENDALTDALRFQSSGESTLSEAKISALRSTRCMLALALIASHKKSIEGDGSSAEAARIIQNTWDPRLDAKEEVENTAQRRPLATSVLAAIGNVLGGGSRSAFSTNVRAAAVALPVFLVVASIRLVLHAARSPSEEGAADEDQESGDLVEASTAIAELTWRSGVATVAGAVFIWAWSR